MIAHKYHNRWVYSRVFANQTADLCEQASKLYVHLPNLNTCVALWHSIYNRFFILKALLGAFYKKKTPTRGLLLQALWNLAKVRCQPFWQRLARMDRGKNVELVSRSRERAGGRLKTLCREREGGRWYAIATYEQFLKNCQFSVFHPPFSCVWCISKTTWNSFRKVKIVNFMNSQSFDPHIGNLDKIFLASVKHLKLGT